MSCSQNQSVCGINGDCGPGGQCVCHEYYIGDDCDFDTRSASGQVYFELYRILVALAFFICFVWGCVCLWRISHKFATCKGYRSSRPLCLIFVTTGTFVRFLMNAIDPECWTGVLPWRLRTLNSLGLVLITSAYSCQILVWIHLQRRLKTDSSKCGSCCVRISPTLLTVATIFFLVFSCILTVLVATGSISDLQQGRLYSVSLALFMLTVIGCSLYFGGRIIMHFYNVSKRASKSPLIPPHKDKALGVMSRYVGVNFLVVFGGMGVLAVSPSGCFAVKEDGPCQLTFFAGFRFFELIGCVFVLIAVGIRRKKPTKVGAEAVNLEKGEPSPVTTGRFQRRSSESESTKSSAVG